MTQRGRMWRNRSLLSLVLVFATSSLAGAQKRISGVAQCGEPAEQHAIAVGDMAGHAFGISKGKCTWTKPFDVEGVMSAEDDITGSSEITGATARERFYVTNNMANGDKGFIRAAGSATLKDGKPQSSRGEWTYTGGTGKLMGIKGKGTYKCAFSADGIATCDVQGHYTVPKKAKG